MRRLIAMGVLLAALTACAPGGGNSPSPYGGGTAPATTAPKAVPVSSPLPSGNPDVDNYGGY